MKEYLIRTIFRWNTFVIVTSMYFKIKESYINVINKICVITYKS